MTGLPGYATQEQSAWLRAHGFPQGNGHGTGWFRWAGDSDWFWAYSGMGAKDFCASPMIISGDPDNPGAVLEVMPWPVYQAMTDRDLQAIYEYLTAIPAVQVNTCGVPSE